MCLLYILFSKYMCSVIVSLIPQFFMSRFRLFIFFFKNSSKNMYDCSLTMSFARLKNQIKQNKKPQNIHFYILSAIAKYPMMYHRVSWIIHWALAIALAKSNIIHSTKSCQYFLMLIFNLCLESFNSLSNINFEHNSIHSFIFCQDYLINVVYIVPLLILQLNILHPYLICNKEKIYRFLWVLMN